MSLLTQSRSTNLSRRIWFYETLRVIAFLTKRFQYFKSILIIIPFSLLKTYTLFFENNEALFLELKINISYQKSER